MTDQQTHSVYGGSSIARAAACPASTTMIARAPPSPDSPYAAEGTVAHKLAELCLKQNLHPRHFLGEAVDPKYPTIFVSEGMCDAVVVYLNAVETEIAQTGTGELYVEQGFVINVPSAELGEVFGTNDALVYHPETGRMVIFDYKHGQGVSVVADDNPQLKFYATGAAFARDDWKVKEIELVIVQPRARDVDELGAVRRCPMDLMALFDFFGEIDTAVLHAKTAKGMLLGKSAKALVSAELGDGVPLFSLGDHCRWCDAGAAGICPAKQEPILKPLADAGLAFAGVDVVSPSALPEPSTFDVDKLAAILTGLGALSGWGDQIRDYIRGLLQSGTQVPGWKLVETVARAKWTGADEDIAGYLSLVYDVPETDLMIRKIVTITEAERLLKAALPADKLKEAKEDMRLRYTIKESSGLSLAPSSDRRPAVDAFAQNFGSVDSTAFN